MSYAEFERVYRRLFGAPPPRDFRRAYDLVREALYWGIARQEPDYAVRRRAKRPGEHWPLHRWELLWPKATADAILAEITRALHRWEVRSKAGGRPPPGHDR